MSKVNDFIDRLEKCPEGRAGWHQFESICIEILTYLFVPPLQKPKIQARSYSGMDRRDVIFPNRNHAADNNWALLYKDLNARMVLFEFKNYDKDEIGKDEVLQTSNYMKSTGNLAIMICNKKPNEAAHNTRSTIYNREGRVILFLTKESLKEMLYSKERGEDPSDIIIDEEELFFFQHE
jgi:hypothetical protein